MNNILMGVKKLVPGAVKTAAKNFVAGMSIDNSKYGYNKQGMRKINIGSGKDRRVGFINLDIDPEVKPDITRDIEKGLPFDDNSVDEIVCSHTLEHIRDLSFVLREFYRVSKPGAKIKITVPLMDASDITHVRFFQEDTFRTLTEPHYWNTSYFVGKFKELDRSFRDLSTCREMTIVLEVIK